MVFSMLVEGAVKLLPVVKTVAAPPASTRAARPNNTQKITLPRRLPPGCLGSATEGA
jgi:hypothetical protein